MTRPAGARTRLFDTRASGVLMHPTSLPGRHGLGDLGAEAHRFAELLATAGQSWWQMLPIGPVGAGNSPYSSPSSFAGSPLLVSLDRLVADGLLAAQEVSAPAPAGTDAEADYRGAVRFREPRLRAACKRFKDRASPALRRELEQFRATNAEWLSDYALFRALQRETRGRSWTEWPTALRRRDPSALALARQRLESEIEYHELVQFFFDHHWRALRAHCRALGIRLLGDVPMFVAHDAAEVWQMSDAFKLDERGRKLVQAGVPPDNFSETGQLWGNPVYDWKVLRKSELPLLGDAAAIALSRFDAVRLDHFIGFHRVWEVPGTRPDGRRGRFVYVPGDQLLTRLATESAACLSSPRTSGSSLPRCTRCATNLHLPGMRVIQFGFDPGASEHLPTATRRGPWLAPEPTTRTPLSAGSPDSVLETRRTESVATSTAVRDTIHWDLIRVLMASVANLLIIPTQDILGLDSSARMNIPGTSRGNWEWRLRSNQLGARVLHDLGRLTADYERSSPSFDD